MSIKAIDYVWSNSPQYSTNLLVLLAIADSVNNDDFSCYGSIGYIAKKSRISESNARRILQELASNHEIIIASGEGIAVNGGFTNRYYVVMAGINCENYDDLCRKIGVEIKEYIPPRSQSKGKKNNPNGVNTSLSTVTGGVTGDSQGDVKDDREGTVNGDSQTVSKKRKKKPSVSGSAKPRDLLFDCLTVNLFDIPLEQKLTKDEGTCIGMVTSDLRKKYTHVSESDLIDRLLRWIENWKETHPPDINLPLASAKVLKHFGKWYDDMGFDLTWKSYIPKKIVRQEDYPS